MPFFVTRRWSGRFAVIAAFLSCGASTLVAQTSTATNALDEAIAAERYITPPELVAKLVTAPRGDNVSFGTPNPGTRQWFVRPYEDHGPIARETVLDQWARWVAWLDKYVKGAGPNGKGPVAMEDAQ